MEAKEDNQKILHSIRLFLEICMWIMEIIVITADLYSCESSTVKFGAKRYWTFVNIFEDKDCIFCSV